MYTTLELVCKGQIYPVIYDYIEKEHFSYLVMQKLDTTLQVNDRVIRI